MQPCYSVTLSEITYSSLDTFYTDVKAVLFVTKISQRPTYLDMNYSIVYLCLFKNFSSLLRRLTLIIRFNLQPLGLIQPSVDQNTPTMQLYRVELSPSSTLEYLVVSL